MMAKSPRMRIMTSCSRMFLSVEPRPIWAGDGQVKVRESDYLDRAFEEKAHGQTPQLFDRVRAPGGAGVRCTVSCCASTSVTRKPVRIIPEVTALAFNRHHRIMDRLGIAVLPYRHW